MTSAIANDEKLFLQNPGLKPIPPGVTLITGSFSALTIQVQHVLLTALAQKSQVLQVPMPDCSKISVINYGTSRQIEVIEQNQKFIGTTQLKSEEIKFEYLTSAAPLKLTSPEMVVHWIRRSKRALKNSCFFLVMRESGEVNNEGLIELSRLGEANNIYFFVICPGFNFKISSRAFIDEWMVVNSIDPDPGFEDSFTIEFPELCSSIQPSLGKVICNIRLGDEGLEHEFAPYVSDDLETRLMAILKEKGWSLQKIGELLDLNKSNVSRRLRNVDGFIPKGWNDEMFREWLNACGVDKENWLLDEEFSDLEESVEDVALDAKANHAMRIRRIRRNKRNKSTVKRR